MAASNGPNTIENGLVLSYDMGNGKKSWKGAPTTNLYTDGDFSSQALHPVRSGTWAIVADPRNNAKKVLKATPSGSNQYHGRDITVTVSSVYSLQMEVYVSADFDGTNVQMYPEQGGGGANIAYNLSNKGTWQLLKFNGKSATTTNIRMLAYVLSAFTTGYVLISNVQVELSSFATPFINGTRSNTQAILDWTGKNTITANSLTYNVDGTASFGSSDNNLQVPHSTNFNFNGTFTVSAWIKINSFNTSSIYNIVSKKASFNNTQKGWSCQYDYRTTGVLQFRNNDGTVLNDSTPTSTIDNTSLLNQTTAWVNSVWVISGVNIFFYINGNQRQNSTATFTNTDTTNSIYIGKTVGSIADPAALMNLDNLNIYNRALTAAEVQQNFNALRGRYGL
jgi:hypothetical protein